MIKYSMNELTTARWPFDKDVEYYAQRGVPAITAQRMKLEPFGVDKGLRLLKDAGLRVAAYQTSGQFTLNDQDRWPKQIDEFKRDMETAVKLGTGLLIFQTGPGEGLSYEETEPRFVEVLERLLPEAQGLGVRLAVEHNSALRVDLGYLGTLHNALDLADKVDSPYLTVCLEMNNAWFERGLYDNIRDRIGRIGVVQIDDFKAGTTTTPSRVPLGDGIIPIERIVNAVLETGYDGYFDIEVLGPHIEEMGYEEAIRRCQVYLERLGPAS